MAGLSVPPWQLKAAGYQPTPPKPVGPPPGPATTPNPAGFTTGTNYGSNGGAAPGSYSQTPGMAPIPGVTPTGVTWNVDPTGTATPYTPNRNWMTGGTDWSAGTGTNLYDQQMQRMMKLLTSMKGEMGGPVGMAREPGLTLAPRETPSTMADRAPAETAAFARAKERLGKIASGSTMALKDAATAGGRAGSGLEKADMRGISEGLQSALGDVVRDQTMDRLERHDDIDDRNLAAGINMRSQDIGQHATSYGGNIQQRGQDFQGAMNDPMRQMMMQMIPGFMSAINYMPRF